MVILHLQDGKVFVLEMKSMIITEFASRHFSPSIKGIYDKG
jgi:hypothetical protein